MHAARAFQIRLPPWGPAASVSRWRTCGSTRLRVSMEHDNEALGLTEGVYMSSGRNVEGNGRKNLGGDDVPRWVEPGHKAQYIVRSYCDGHGEAGP